MKIAFVSRWFVEEQKRSGGRGGTEQQRVRGYVEAGHEVVVLSQSGESRGMEVGEVNGIRVVTTPRWERLGWLAPLDKLVKPWAHHRKLMSDAWGLRKFLRRFGPFDVLEAQCEEPDGMVAAVASLFGPMPPWCIQLFALRYRFAGTTPIFTQRSSLGFAFRRTNLVKANSGLVAECLQRHYGCSGEKIRIVHPNAVFPSELQGVERDGGILCMGPLTRTKGVETFLEAAKELGREQIAMSVVGGFGESKEYSRWLQAEMVSRGVNWRGELGREELHREMNRARLVVVASWFDAWNRAAIEAVSLGTPVVISDHCGAARWIYENGAGVIFRSGSSSDLAEAIRRALADKGLAERTKKAGALARRLFGPEEIARVNLEVLEKLASESGEALLRKVG